MLLLLAPQSSRGYSFHVAIDLGFLGILLHAFVKSFSQPLCDMSSASGFELRKSCPDSYYHTIVNFTRLHICYVQFVQNWMLLRYVSRSGCFDRMSSK